MHRRFPGAYINKRNELVQCVCAAGRAKLMKANTTCICYVPFSFLALIIYFNKCLDDFFLFVEGLRGNCVLFAVVYVMD